MVLCDPRGGLAVMAPILTALDEADEEEKDMFPLSCEGKIPQVQGHGSGY